MAETVAVASSYDGGSRSAAPRRNAIVGRAEELGRLERGLDDAAVAEVDTVERADRDGVTHERRASASSDGITRSSSASSTRNGPIAVRTSRVRCAPHPSSRPASATRTRT